MEIAISSKSGVGKTLLASLLFRVFADGGYSVTAIDAALANLPIFESRQQIITEVSNIYQALLSTTQAVSTINRSERFRQRILK